MIPKKPKQPKEKKQGHNQKRRFIRVESGPDIRRKKA